LQPLLHIGGFHDFRFPNNDVDLLMLESKSSFKRQLNLLHAETHLPDESHKVGSCMSRLAFKVLCALIIQPLCEKRTITVVEFRSRLTDDLLLLSLKRFQYFTVVKHVKNYQNCLEEGETKEFEDEVNYLLEGLQPSQPLSVRYVEAIVIETTTTFFVWFNFVSLDVECCCLKPVHGVIVESRQT